MTSCRYVRDAFGFADQLFDLADGGFACDRRDGHIDASGQVRGAGVDILAGLHFDRHGFAGQRGLVDA